MTLAPDHRVHVDTVRAFNRFYTRQIGVLGERLLESPYSLTETRVLYELTHRDAPTAADLGRDLGLDAGYLSRILRRFETRGLVGRGPAAFAPLETRAREQVAGMLARLAVPKRRQVVEAMATIERLLGARPPDA